MTVNDNPRVKMVFRVEPFDGGAPFDAEKTTTVSRVEIPRQGDRYPVWYDAQDPSNLGVRDDRRRQRPRDDAPDVRRRRRDVRRHERAGRARGGRAAARTRSSS